MKLNVKVLKNSKKHLLIKCLYLFLAITLCSLMIPWGIKATAQQVNSDSVSDNSEKELVNQKDNISDSSEKEAEEATNQEDNIEVKIHAKEHGKIQFTDAGELVYDLTLTVPRNSKLKVYDDGVDINRDTIFAIADEGYRYECWQDTKGKQWYPGYSQVLDDNIEFYAIFEVAVQQYRASFNPGDGSVWGNIPNGWIQPHGSEAAYRYFNEGTSFSEILHQWDNYNPESFTEGVNFRSWELQTECEKPQLFQDTEWKATYDCCVATFEPCNGQDQIVKKIPYGESIEIPEDPVLPGFDFYGWSDGQKLVSDGQKLFSDLNLVAIYIPKTSETEKLWSFGKVGLEMEWGDFREFPDSTAVPIDKDNILSFVGGKSSDGFCTDVYYGKINNTWPARLDMCGSTTDTSHYFMLNIPEGKFLSQIRFQAAENFEEEQVPQLFFGKTNKFEDAMYTTTLSKSNDWYTYTVDTDEPLTGQTYIGVKIPSEDNFVNFINIIADLHDMPTVNVELKAQGNGSGNISQSSVVVPEGSVFNSKFDKKGGYVTFQDKDGKQIANVEISADDNSYVANVAPSTGVVSKGMEPIIVNFELNPPSTDINNSSNIENQNGFSNNTAQTGDSLNVPFIILAVLIVIAAITIIVYFCRKNKK